MGLGLGLGLGVGVGVGLGLVEEGRIQHLLQLVLEAREPYA